MLVCKAYLTQIVGLFSQRIKEMTSKLELTPLRKVIDSSEYLENITVVMLALVST